MTRERLSSGLVVTTVVRRPAPVVSLRLVVSSGSASDGDNPGVARLTGELMADAGAGNWSRTRFRNRLAELGTQLQVRTSQDATEWSLSVTSNHLDAALDLLGAIVLRPRLSIGTFTELKSRLAERARSAARSDPGWGANWVLYRALFRLPTHSHPYSLFRATEAQLTTLRLVDCVRWHRARVTPENSVLFVVGDVEAETVRPAAERSFRGWKGGRPPPPRFIQPVAPDRVRVYLVDHPKATRAAVRVGLLGPNVRDADYAALTAAADLLGAPEGGRLELDLVLTQSLAERARAGWSRVAHGSIPLVVSASTHTQATPRVLASMLDHIQRLGANEPDPEEVLGATQRLATRQARRAETVEGLSLLLSEYEVLGLSSADVSQQRDTWRKLTAASLRAATAAHFRVERAVVAVATDARRVERALSRFGEVEVVAPEQGFTVKRRIRRDPSAPLTVTAPD